MKFALGRFEHLIGVVKAAALLCLIGKRLGGAKAGQRRFDFGVDGAGFLLGALGGLPHIAAAAHDHQQKDGDNHANHQRQPPLHGKHDGQCADNRDGRDEQVLRAVMRQLRHLKQVRGQTAHQLTRAVLVVKIKAQLLHMAEQVPPDVRFHADAEGMAPVAHHKIEQ